MGLERVFLQLLNMSITAGYVIIAIFLIRLCIQRLPKVYSYILWSVVAFRLLCPFSFSSAYSFFNLNYFNEMKKTETGIQYIAVETEPEETGNGPVMENQTVLPFAGAAPDTVRMGQSAEPSAHKADYKEQLPRIFSFVWIFGIGILILYSFWEIGKIKRQTADAVLAEGNIYESDRICQPFVFGIVHPQIYIPFRLQGEEREYILGHERYHIRRKDYLVKGIAYGIAIVYWFHPLVWAAYYFMCQDMEMSCDEKVISSHGTGIKQSYGRLLLSFATGKRRLAGPLNFGESNAGKRIKNVLKFKKMGITAAVLGAVLLALLCLIFATNGKSGGGSNSVTISVTDEQPVLSSTMIPGESVKGDFEFTEEIESYLVYADIYKSGVFEGRRVIVSHDMTAYEDGFEPMTGFWVNEEGGDTEGEQSSIAISYNTGMISRVSNIPISERAAAVAADTLWMDGRSHEIQADTPYIYMAKYIGYGDINEIECFRCENLNNADEEEWQRCINQECITVLLYFVFSEKPERELFKEYGDAKSPNDMFARDEEEDSGLEQAESENGIINADEEAETSENVEEEAQKPAESDLQETELWASMDRVIEKYWDDESGGHRGDCAWVDFLMEYKKGNEDFLWEDHLVYFEGVDGADGERVDVYGVISPEFGTKGIIMDYRENASDDSNMNYFDWDWDERSFGLSMADFDKDGRNEIYFRIVGQVDADIMFRQRLFICETYETGHVEPYELTCEMIDEEAELLLEAEVMEDEHRVKISEKGTDRVLIPKLFYPGEGEFEKMCYSDWFWIDYEESTGDIFLVVYPTVHVKDNPELAAENFGSNAFRTENERLEFKIKYDYSASLDGGYFTLTAPSRFSDASDN